MIGQTIAHYCVVEKLGSGGMGLVYRAEDIRLHRFVALKFLPENLANDRRALQRFEREARSASCLNHPNICTIYEVEEHDRMPVIVMELLQGESLKERIRKGPLPADELMDLGIQSADALEAAHVKGIVHRDIKPGNIFLVGQNRVKVLDFGLAKALSSTIDDDQADEESLTQQGVIPGTTAYMSPEQVRGEGIDGRSDLFSLGVVLYEAATGQKPFMGKNRVLTLDAILHTQPESPSHLNPALPSELDGIICKAMEKRIELRYQHATELKSDLQQLRRVSESGAARVAIPGSSAIKALPRTTRLSARLRKLLLPAGILLAIASFVLVILHTRRAPALTEKDTIVLADFDNKTGDPVFDDTLKQALAVDLGQSPFLNILSDRQVAPMLRMMGLAPDQRATQDVARDLCQRLGSKAMLAGSISALGSNYVLGLNAVNCASSEVLVREQTEARGKEDVLRALGTAATDMRRHLGESLASIHKLATPIEQATTSSLEALKAYSLGRKLGATKGDVAAIPYHLQAIELDPNFAMAYSALAVGYFNLGQTTRASENASRAFELRDRVSERERYRISARYYEDVTGELDKAIQSYELWRQNYPRDHLPSLNLGNINMELGQYEKALAPTEDSLRLEPTSNAYDNLAVIQLALNRPDQVRSTIDEATARNIDSYLLRIVRYQEAFLRADAKLMEQQLAWAAGRPGEEDWLLSAQSDTEAYFGRLGKSREFSRRAVESAVRADESETAAMWQVSAALREAEFGNALTARQQALAALARFRGKNIRIFAAMALARTGERVESQKLAEGLNKDFPRNILLQSYWLPSIEAAIQLDSNKATAALQVLQPAAPFELGQSEPYQLGMLYPPYLRGQAYLLAHQGDEAVNEFQKIIARRGIVVNFPVGALAHLGLARAYALAGETTKSRAAYQDFLSLWKDGDPDIPILKKANAEYAKLH